MSDALESDFDADDRRLCPDGSCTGLLGADGRCKECGRSADGTGGDPPPSRWRGEDRDEEALDVPASEPAFDADEDRQLCSDGACTGILGSDGKCKLCGLLAAT